MKLAAVLLLSLALPACAAVGPAPAYVPEGGSSTNLSGKDDDEDWYSGSPTGVKEFGRQGGYAEIGLVKSSERFARGATETPGDTSDMHGTSNPGITFRGGWRTKEGLALEGIVDSITGYHVGADTTKSVLDMDKVAFRGKYYLWQKRFQPYAFVGAGYAWVHADEANVKNANGIYATFGAGLDIYLTLDVGVFLEASYNRTTGDIRDLDHVDLAGGVIFRF